MKKLLLTLMCLLGVAAWSMADELTFDFSKVGYTDEGCTTTCEIGSSNTLSTFYMKVDDNVYEFKATNAYFNKDGYHMVNSSTGSITLPVIDGSITKITAVTRKNASTAVTVAIKNTDGTQVVAAKQWNATDYTTVYEIPSQYGEDQLVLVNTHSSKNAQITKITIEYTPAAGPGVVTVPVPTFSEAAGTFLAGKVVTLSCTDAAATVYYATATELGASEATADAIKALNHTGNITLAATDTYYAVAFDADGNASRVASAKYTVLTLDGAGTEADPFTISDAKKVIDNGLTSQVPTTVYVKGYVVDPGTVSSGKCNIYLAETSTSNTKEFELFKCKGLNNADFTKPLEKGDFVVAAGPLTKYNSTYELNAGCYIVSVVSKQPVEIIWIKDAYTYTLGVSTEANLPQFMVDPEGLAYVYTSSNEAVATFVDGVITIVGAEGETKLTVSYPGDDTYKGTSASCTLTVTKKPVEIIWGEPAYTYTLGVSTTLPEFDVDPEGLAYVYTSSNTAVATFVDGVITIKGAEGTTTLTVSYPGDDAYTSASESCTLTVIDPSIETLTYSTDTNAPFNGVSYSTAKYYHSDKSLVYYGAVASVNKAWQLNTGKNAAIVVEKNPMGYTINTLKITWKANSNTRKIDVYGSNEPFIVSNFSTSGATKIGTYSNGTTATTTEITPEAAYKYFAIEANDGALLVSEIKVKWAEPAEEDAATFTYRNEGLGSHHVTNEVCKDIKIIDEKEVWDGGWAANEIELNDNDNFNHHLDITSYKGTTYTREIAEGKTNNWHAIYLPFDVEDASDLATRVIKFAGVESDGNDGVSLVFEDLKDDEKLEAHNIYFFKPASANCGVMNTAETIVKAAPFTNTTVSFDLDGLSYNLTGTYKNMTGLKTLNAYALSGGNFVGAKNDAVVLKPYRAYLTVTPVDGAAPQAMPAKIAMKVKDDVDAIEAVAIDRPADGACYNLQGIRVDNPAPGLYIRDGKKVYVK